LKKIEEEKNKYKRAKIEEWNEEDKKNRRE